jgi:hypothetical protein
MIVINSKQISQDVLEKGGEELISFLGDLENYQPHTLRWIIRVCYIVMQIQRFTRTEQKSIIAHCLWLLNQKEKEKPPSEFMDPPAGYKG